MTTYAYTLFQFGREYWYMWDRIL